MLRYRLTSRLALAAGIDMTHWSNGNTSWPNPGVNSIGGRAGLIYTFDSRATQATIRLTGVWSSSYFFQPNDAPKFHS